MTNQITCADGSQRWYVDDKLHREDGPAVIHADGYQAWFIDGVGVKEENFEESVKFYLCRKVLES